MLRAFLGVGVVILLASSASAQQLTVRSGEHDTFSRLVIPFPQGTVWDLAQNSERATLTVNPETFRYDLQSVFNLIPKSRILALGAEVNSAKLEISMSGAVHAKAFQLASGALVIDVIDGALETASGPVSTTSVSAGALSLPDHLDLYWRGQSDGETSEIITPAESSRLDLPSERIMASERQLLENLSRAASQGLIGVDVARTFPKVIQSEFVVDDAMESERAGAAGSSLPIRSLTAIDRDLGITDRHAQVLPLGNLCMADSLFALETWRTNEEPSKQIAEARANLVAEFDSPKPEEVERLAKTYLALGFGAEASAVLRSFGSSTNATPALKYIADVLEEIPPENDTVSKGMTACDGKVALWSLLGSTEGIPADEINLSAVQEGFSALPRDIRESLGPRLVKKLLDAGAKDTVNAIENVLRRTDRPGELSLPISAAEIALAADDPERAEKELRSAITSRDVRSARALALSVEARLRRGQVIDRATIDHIAALAHQMANSEIGILLIRGEILGEGSMGEFDEAFALLEAWPPEDNGVLREGTRTDLVALLERVPDDVAFASQVFKRLSGGTLNNLAPDRQIALSKRLGDLGFARAATELLSDNVKHTSAGLVQLASAALIDQDASAALAHTRDMEGERVQQIRAAALSMLGEYSEAASLYEQNGDRDAAAREAWRGGVLEIISRNGTEVEKAAIAGISWMNGQPVAPVYRGDSTTGLLTRANELIERSEVERGRIEGLLSETLVE